jgi:hypothetical protein
VTDELRANGTVSISGYIQSLFVSAIQGTFLLGRTTVRIQYRMVRKPRTVEQCAEKQKRVSWY